MQINRTEENPGMSAEIVFGGEEGSACEISTNWIELKHISGFCVGRKWRMGVKLRCTQVTCEH